MVGLVLLVPNSCLRDPDAAKHLNKLVTAQCQNSSKAVEETGHLWMKGLRQKHLVMRGEFEAFIAAGHAVPQFHTEDHFNDPDGDEYQSLLAEDNITEVSGALWLKVWGKETSMAKHFFPETLKAIRQAPLTTAMLSIVEPYRGVNWHRGDFNGVLRYHVGISIPSSTTRAPDSHLLVHDRKPQGQVLQRVIFLSDVVREDCPLMLTYILQLIANRVVFFAPEFQKIYKWTNKRADLMAGHAIQGLKSFLQ